MSVGYGSAADHLKTCPHRPASGSLGINYQAVADSIGGAVQCPVS
jgi:hypothetical protein